MLVEQDVQQIKADLHEVRRDVKNLLIISTKNEANLGEHMKRTELAEKRIQALEYFILGLLSAVVVAVIKLVAF